MKEIKCVDCGTVFKMEDGEVKWFEDKGFELPKRCPDCRAAKKAKYDKHRKDRDNNE